MNWFVPFQRFRKTRSSRRLVSAIREAAASLRDSSDADLKTQADELRERIFQGRSPADDDILVPGFALMNEAVRRSLSLEYFEGQLLAGVALARGQIAEMQTGEGKTLSAALPAFVHALTGRGVHVVTANSYLAGRDCALLAPAFEWLGLSARLLPERSAPGQKRSAYRADITYGTGYEFGFDYLRDQVAVRKWEQEPLGRSVLNHLSGIDESDRFLQRGLAFAIIDEVDSVLIDDANSPLILSESSEDLADDAPVHKIARDRLESLEPDRDYWIDPAAGEVQLTEAGSQKIHEDLSSIPLKQLKRPWADYVRQALRAEHLYRRNVQYIVREGRIQLVEESTGRVFEDRHWRDGLHQAIEAKEELAVTAEKLPIAQITRQRFYRLYEGLCGMTGTAVGSEAEFSTFYGLSVVPIPLRKPSQRTVLPARYFADSDARWRAVAEAVRERQSLGQPVLIGTRTIADSLALAERFRSAGISHQLLNGCQDEAEAEIIARAGHAGAVTIATNMAGRGTDILLSPESLAAGGLFVIGTQRHDSSRVDRQLFGRCARQGDPGCAQFFLSADDALIARHEPQLARLMKRAAGPEGEVFLKIDSLLNRTQKRIERSHYHHRRELFEYDQYRESVLIRMHGGE